MKKRRLRWGYTTGTCAAAAAKAAVLLLLGEHVSAVEIALPDGSRHRLPVYRLRREGDQATASVIKDAGDDPDVTNRAEIVATVRRIPGSAGEVVLRGGPGVGVVTKPGLPVPVGEAAINPVPRRMIKEAVQEALAGKDWALEVVISVPRGEELARQTLNPRLGIKGGISILGTTGLVKPLSAEAWTATITSALKVARAVGLTEVVLSTGRTSEKAHQEAYAFPEEAYILMGDFVEFALRETQRLGFSGLHLVAQWAKLLKIARAALKPPKVREPYGYTTHVRHGILSPEEALEILQKAGLSSPPRKTFHTVRELFLWLDQQPSEIRKEVFRGVCRLAREYVLEKAPHLALHIYLVDYKHRIREVLS